MSTHSDINNACHTFIDSLDRRVMGDLASHRFSLFLAHQIFVYSLLADVLNDRIAAGDASDDVRDELDAMIRLGNDTKRRFDLGSSKEACEMVTAELLYWWTVSGNPVMEAKARSQKVSASSVRVASIIENPDMHDYFVAGIWDVGVVRQFIEQDIDVELAVSLTLS